MNTFLVIYQAVPTELWIGLFGGGFTTWVVQRLKRLLGIDKAKLLIHILSSTVAVLLVAVPAILQNPLPLGIAAEYASYIYGAANILYAVAKVSRGFLGDVQAEVAKHHAQAAPTEQLVPAVAPASTPVPQYEG
jgi:hypothetical protein